MKNQNKKIPVWYYLAGLALVAGLGIFILRTRTAHPASTTAGDSSAEILTEAQKVHAECEIKSGMIAETGCYKQNFKTFMESQGTAGGRQTLLLLDDLQQLGGFAQVQCHPLAHIVGSLAFDYYGSVQAAAPYYLPTCASGYYHGLLEGYLATAKDYATGVKEVCGTPTDATYFNWFQCTHGLGHGVMDYRNDDVPKSLADCDTIDPQRQAQEICYAGVFMENITTDIKTGRPSKFIKAEDPIYPCDFVAVKYKSACYFLSSSQILKLNNWNFADAFKTCDTKAEKDYLWLCYESMGRDVSGSSLRNKAKVNELCMLGAPAMRGECFFGAVRDFINDQGKFDTAVDLCNFIPADYRTKCFSGIFLDLGLYKKGQDFLNTCATMPEPYKTQCSAEVKYN